jgi:hypothetical protein
LHLYDLGCWPSARTEESHSGIQLEATELGLFGEICKRQIFFQNLDNRQFKIPSMSSIYKKIYGLENSLDYKLRIWIYFKLNV